jgi:hypothetical protein
MGSPIGMQIDHRDTNGLNNQKTNLRICTVAQNQMNKRKSPNKSSQYKGVFWHKNKERWKATIRVNDTNIHLGSFKVEKEAALAYDKIAMEWCGQYARLNFPDLHGKIWDDEKGWV